MKKICLSLLAMIGASFPMTAAAQEAGNFAIGAGVGTNGLVGEIQYRINDYFQLRASGNYLKFDEDFDVEDANYNGELDVSGGGVFVDAHPFKNSFFISGGAYIGTKQVGLMATSDSTYTVNGVTYGPNEYGRVVGGVEFDDVAPFIGLGYDNTFTSGGNWGFEAFVGAAFFGSGDVSLNAEGGTLSNDPNLQSELDDQAQELESDIEDYKVYPIVQIGVTYRF